jgi:transposase
MGNKELFLGIDASKGYADFALMNVALELSEPCFQLDDTNSGHEKLREIIETYFLSNPEMTLYCGIESTGGYERNWLNYLLFLGVRIKMKSVLINPALVKGISKAALNRSITDETSAINVALYLANFKNKILYLQEDGQQKSPFESGRSLYTYQKMIVKQSVQLQNQLEKIIYQHFSEALVYCRHGMPKWLLRVLNKYPSPNDICKAGTTKLLKIKGVSEQRAQGLIKKAKQNSQYCDRDIIFIINHTTAEIIHKEEEIDAIDKYMAKEYSHHPLVKLLSTIMGVGTMTAILILFEIEEINRFATAKKLVAYFGLNPEYRISGDGKWGNHLSKKGRKMMRARLYMCCLTAANRDPMMKQLYAKYRGMGKDHYFAMGVLMHKMLRVIYGMLKSGKPYDIAIDQQNREKSSEKQGDLAQQKLQQVRENRKKSRRYLSENTEDVAPISKWKHKKLKELEESQAPESALIRDHPQFCQK